MFHEWGLVCRAFVLFAVRNSLYNYNIRIQQKKSNASVHVETASQKGARVFRPALATAETLNFILFQETVVIIVSLEVLH